MADNEHKYITVHKNGKTIIKDETLKEEKLQHKKERNQNIKSRFSSYFSNPSGLLGSIILILVGISMIRLLYNGSSDVVSFRSLFDLLSKAPPVSTSVKNFVQQLQLSGEWVILDGFRVFLNSIIQIVSIGVWMASSLIDVLFFLAYFLAWIFV